MLFTSCVADIDLISRPGDNLQRRASPSICHVIRRAGPFRKARPIIGIREDIAYRNAEYPFLRGDSLCNLHGRNYEDLFQQRGSMDMGPVEEVLRKNSGKKPSDFVEDVVRDVLAQIDRGELSDDVTLIMARRA